MQPLIWYPGHEVLLNDIVRAENCSLFDAQGMRYVDLESGVWSTAIGHAHPAILQVMATQAARLTHTGFCYTSQVTVDSARDILRLLGFAKGRCTFLCSGSEAVEYSVRVAQALGDKSRLLTMQDSYCGSYGSAWEKSEKDWFCLDWTVCAGCPDSVSCRQCPHWQAIPFAELGGFLFEPGSSSGLVRFPPEKLITSLAAEIRANHGLVIANEVTTGLGRTGRWFGYQHYGIEPDIVTIGKGIGNGYPVSVAACSAQVVERLGDRQVPYAQSHQNDPLGAAIAREVLRVIAAEGLIERSRDVSALLLRGLEGIRQRVGRLTEIRARGLMLALVLEDDPDSSFTTRVHRALVRQGYIVAKRPGLNVLRLDPSLTIEREDAEGFLGALEDVLTTEG